jgi:hypothetical protein
MVQQSQSALEAYCCTGSGVAHDRVREWVDTYNQFPIKIRGDQ